MYKVFVNEKKLLLSKIPQSIEKNILYENTATIEMAIDLLQNTSCKELNLYSDNLEQLWDDFKSCLKVIEAAGGIVKNQENAILFIRRLGRWDLPKGKIEKDESIEETAIRELEEETGIADLELEDYINNTFHIYTERNGENVLKITHWFAMKKTGDHVAKPQIEEGISEIRWMNLQEIQDIAFQNTFKNIKLILKEYFDLVK